MSTTDLADDPAAFNQVYWTELQALRPQLAAAQKKAPLASATSSTATVPSAPDLASLYKTAGALGTNSQPDAEPLSALCLSGGGIRSATFNLGVVQALARYDLLGKFDYLSSVSGGGYVASWLHAWIARTRMAAAKEAETAGESGKLTPSAPETGIERVSRELAQLNAPSEPLQPEPTPVRNLREYSNYLTPKLGLFSADTWTLAAIALRNMLLNWLIVIPLLASIVALPQLFYLFILSKSPPFFGRALLGAALALELVASYFVYRYRRFGRRENIPEWRYVMFCIAPIIAAAAVLCGAAAELRLPWTQGIAAPLWADRLWLAGFAVVWCVGVPALGWLAAETGYRRRVWKRAARDEAQFRVRAADVRIARFELASIVLSGLIAAALLYAMTTLWLPFLLQRPGWFVILGLPSLLALYLLARTLFVAGASLSESIVEVRGDRRVSTSQKNDQEREWWARLSGWVLAISIVWTFGVGASLFGQHILGEAEGYIRSAVAAIGGASGLVAALLGSRDTSALGESKMPQLQRIALATAAPAFVVCVIFLISWGNALLGGLLLGDPQVLKMGAHATTAGVTIMDCVRFFGMAVLLFVVAELAGMVVNINRFSLHGMYRNRLIRAYLGASNPHRDADPFTGFALSDNLLMHELREPAGPQKLLPLVNLTLNLVSGGKLAWQQRKAQSFSVTPYFCGNFEEGYRPTERYGGQQGMSLGTAITISGAAANPNMGYCSSPPLSFVMTLFNARLGAWLGNTNEHGRDTYRQGGPANALRPLLAELFGWTNNKSKYINLSDGGHFDNLGLYEVVLRRCRFVLVCDSGRDGDYTFADLGAAIRKIRIDFGIRIDFKDQIRIFPAKSEKSTMGMYCASADICYGDIDSGAPSGKLIYIKPTMSGPDRPPRPYDIYSYWKATPEFPHESTTDQWFDESQFESYRMLGWYAMHQIIGTGPGAMTLKEFDAAVDAHLGVAAATAAGVNPAATMTSLSAPVAEGVRI